MNLRRIWGNEDFTSLF